MKTVLDANGVAWLVVHGDPNLQGRLLAAPVGKSERAMWQHLLVGVSGVFFLACSLLLLGSGHGRLSGITTSLGVLFVVLAARALPFRRVSNIECAQVIPTTLASKLHLLSSACAFSLLVFQLVFLISEITQL